MWNTVLWALIIPYKVPNVSSFPCAMPKIPRTGEQNRHPALFHFHSHIQGEELSINQPWGGWWTESGDHQLRLVYFPIIYRVLAPSQVVGLGISEPSTVTVNTLRNKKSKNLSWPNMLSISFYINCFSEVTVQPCLGWKKTDTVPPHIPLAPNVPSPFQGHSSGCSWTPFENNIETRRTPRRWPIWKMCKTCKTMGTMEIRSQPRDDSVWQHDPQPKHHFFCWWKRHRMPHWTTDPVMQALVWRGNNLKKELDLRKICDDFVWWFLSGH